MAGTDKPTVPAGGSGPEQIQQLLALMSNNQQTSKTTSDVGGLKTVLDQLLQAANAPGADPQALLQSIFQQGAAKVPGLVAGTYNASGSRAAPGTMSPKLAELQAQITLAAQQQLAAQQLQQQQLKAQTLGQAGTVAGNIAQGTRTTSANTGNNITQALNKIVQLNSLGKMATGVDVLGKGKQMLTDLIDPTPNYFNGEGFSVASPNIGGITLGGSPSAGLPQVFNQVDFSTGYDAAQPGPDLSSILTSSNSAPLIDLSTAFSNSGADAANSASSALDTTSLSTTSPDWSTAGESFGNFSSGTDAAAASGSAGNSGGLSAAGYLKIGDYLTNDKKGKDILDFSDGGWADDAGDIGDAASIIYPYAALVRPAAMIGAEWGKDTDDFIHNPGDNPEWLLDMGGNPLMKYMRENGEAMLNNPLDRLTTKADQIWEGVGGTVEAAGNSIGGAIVDVGHGLEEVVDKAGDVVEDVFSDIGDVFGW